MTEAELLDCFSEILGDLLADSNIRLTMDTIRQEVDGWDSFHYINFVAAIEAKLGVKFSMADVESFESVGEIVKAAQSQLRKA